MPEKCECCQGSIDPNTETVPCLRCGRELCDECIAEYNHDGQPICIDCIDEDDPDVNAD